MCYAKPGPRCAYHLERQITSLNEKIEKTDPSDETLLKVLHDKKKQAQLEYLLTTKSLKANEENIQDLKNRYGLTAQVTELEEKLEKLQGIRASKIAASKNPNKATNSNPNENNFSYLDAKTAYDQFTQEEIDAMEPANRPPSKVNLDYNDLNLAEQGITGEYDSKECSNYDCDQDYCGDIEYINLRVDDSPRTINPRSILAYKMKCDPLDVPDELINEFKNRNYDSPDNYDISTEYGYYGAEGWSIHSYNNDGINEIINQHYINEGNSTDSDGVYALVRRNNIETKGLTRKEALETYLKEKRILKAGESIHTIKRETFHHTGKKEENWYYGEHHSMKAQIVTPNTKKYRDAPVATTVAKHSNEIIATKRNSKIYILDGFSEYKALSAKTSRDFKFLMIS